MALITGFNGSLTGQASSTTSATEEIAAATRYLVEGAVDMGGATPALIEGKSYVSSTTGGGFTENYIYVASAGSWLEVVPTEGIEVYDRATDTEYVVGADGSLGAGGNGGTTTVVDVLTSTSATSALSANQGNVLDGKKLEIPVEVNLNNDATAALPTGQKAGYTVKFLNADAAGTTMGAANPLTVNTGEVWAVRNGVTASSNDGADWIQVAGEGNPTGGDLLADGTVAMTADLDLGGNKLINLATGVNPSDAVTKQQLDDSLSALGTVEHEAADIAARDALLAADLSIGDNVFVTDASGDTTVDAGWALYRVTAVTPALGFLKIHEQEGLDVSVRTTLQSWQAANDYVAGQLVEQDHRTLKAKAAFTSAATFTAAEAANWACVGQTSWTVWAPSTIYVEGELVRYVNRLYRCSATFTSATDFNIGNFPLEFNGETLADWAADTRYEVGQLAKRNNLVLQRAFQVSGGGVSESTFDATEAARWIALSQPVPFEDWQDDTVYVAGQQVNFGGLFYSRISSGKSGVDFAPADWNLSYSGFASDVAAQLEKWDRSTAGEGHELSEEFIDGTYYVRLSGNSTTDFAFFGTQVSPDGDRTVRLRIRRDTGATANGNLRFSSPNGYVDFIFNPTNGTTTIETGTIGPDVNAPTILHSVTRIDSFEWVLRYPAPNDDSLDYFLVLIPDHSSLITPTTPDVALAGGIDISLMNIDYDYVPAGETVATRIDSSLAPVNELLSASTDSGIVKLFTNIDVTNLATLSVDAGQTLNGITDGTFLFSNYPAETQFRADEVAGGWTVSVSGASTTQERMIYSLRGISLVDMSAQTSGGITTIDLGNMLPSVSTDGGTFPVAEIDGMSARTGNVITIPAGHGGTYRMGYLLNHDDTSITGTSTSQSTTDTNRAGIRINGSAIQWLSLDDGTGLPDLFDRGSYTLIEFNENDQIEIVVNSDASGGNEEWIVFFSLEEVDTSEVVLAGMVQATDLASVVYTLSADASGIVCPFDQGQGDTSKIPNAAGTITLPVGKHRIVPHATRQNAVLDYELYDVTNSAVLERYSNSGTSQDASQGSAAPHYLTVSVPTQIQIREGGGATSVVWNGREAGIDAGHDDALYNYACWLDIQQVSTASVVTPGNVPVEDLEVLLVDALTDYTMPQSADTTASYTLPNGVTWNDIISAYEYIDIQLETSVHAAESRFHIDRINPTETLEIALFDTRFVLLTIDPDINTGDFSLQAAGAGMALNDFEIRGVKKQKTVVSIKATDAEFFPPTDYTPVLHATTTDPVPSGTTAILGTYSGVVGPDSGDKGMLEINIQYAQTVAGTAGDGTYFFGLPAGFTVDPTYIQAVATDPEDMRAWGVLTHVTDDTSDTHQNGEIHLIQNAGGTASGLAMSSHDDLQGSLSRAYVDNTFYDVAVAVMEYKLFAKVPVVRV